MCACAGLRVKFAIAETLAEPRFLSRVQNRGHGSARQKSGPAGVALPPMLCCMIIIVFCLCIYMYMHTSVCAHVVHTMYPFPTLHVCVCTLPSACQPVPSWWSLVGVSLLSCPEPPVPQEPAALAAGTCATDWKERNRGFSNCIRRVSRVICDCFLEALVMGNGAEVSPLGGSGGMLPRKYLKIDPQRRNILDWCIFETNEDGDNYWAFRRKFVCVWTTIHATRLELAIAVNLDSRLIH